MVDGVDEVGGLDEADRAGGAGGAGAPEGRIAVLIPAYQASATLPETLRSLQAQTRGDWIAVVVDDGSTDGTGAVAEQLGDPRISVVRRPNGGIAAARNTGLDNLPPSARFVTFLDADDVLLPHALAALTAALEANPSVEFVHALAETVDFRGELLDEGGWPDFMRRRWGLEGRRFVPLPVHAPTTLDSVLHDWRGYPPAVWLIRRSAVDAVGRFDGSIPMCDDWDYVRRLARRQPLLLLDEVVAHYRRHERNATNDGDAARVGARAFYRKALHDPEDDPRSRATARRAWRALQVEAGAAAARRVPAALRERRPAAAGRDVAAVGVHLARWLRGSTFSAPRR
ncbi:glycosyltransferase family 2 protein [Kineococcus sp. SYSU DK006]|uniref:glycosyltransferase family 2 protein n=1 Tax=Kineococcus sp. SYSU DK006 TaxID=3383127 RepID=UPI003D7E5155